MSEPAAAPRRRRKVLFLAEAVTLAHVARPIALADALDDSRYDVVVAGDARYRRFLTGHRWPTVQLASIPSEQFMRALARGSPVYTFENLRDYVAEDLALIERIAPDVVVGDFRLSLSVSARLARVPYIAITNSYWSPYRLRERFPLPELPMTRVLPLPLADAIFRLAQPLAFALHCKPLNRLRREHGLTSLGNDICRVYTDADCTVYADDPRGVDMAPLPADHRFIGPIVWSPPVDRPPWWDALPADRPIVYVTLGSSGSAAVLNTVLAALAPLPLTMVVATAGARLDARHLANAWVADYLPGVEAASRSRLVICNGGSPTCQQAAAAGVPVLGIASNMDQFMNMETVVRLKAGVAMRADRLSPGRIAATVRELLSSAASAAAVPRTWDAQREFASCLETIA